MRSNKIFIRIMIIASLAWMPLGAHGVKYPGVYKMLLAAGLSSGVASIALLLREKSLQQRLESELDSSSVSKILSWDERLALRNELDALAAVRSWLYKSAASGLGSALFMRLFMHSSPQSQTPTVTPSVLLPKPPSATGATSATGSKLPDFSLGAGAPVTDSQLPTTKTKIEAAAYFATDLNGVEEFKCSD